MIVDVINFTRLGHVFACQCSVAKSGILLVLLLLVSDASTEALL
jgi:hypothetical protein